jgi:hypothetical protein
MGRKREGGKDRGKEIEGQKEEEGFKKTVKIARATAKEDKKSKKEQRKRKRKRKSEWGGLYLQAAKTTPTLDTATALTVWGRDGRTYTRVR